MIQDGPKASYPSRELSNEALEWIVRLNSGKARKRDWAEFEAWRSQSAEHEAAGVEAEALWGDASNLHWDPETGTVRPGRRARVGLSRRAILGGIAGAGLSGAGALWASGAFRPLFADHVTGVGELSTVDLTDGTRVSLNAMSAIKIDYSPSLRRVVLVEGQAYFEVAPNAERPFAVEGRGTKVTALGTAFDVDCSLAWGRVSVSAIEHSVRVQSQGNVVGTILSEDRKVIVSDTGLIGPATQQDRQTAIAWKTGTLIAEDLELGDVVAALRAYHRGWIVFQDAGAERLKVNAVLSLRTPDASIDALAAGLPINVRRLSSFVTVISIT